MTFSCHIFHFTTKYASLIERSFMTYQEFILAIKDAVARITGPSLTLQTRTSLKNNGHERAGLTFSQENKSLSPTIYLEEFYQRYLCGDSIDELAEQIMYVYHKSQWKPQKDIQQWNNFKFIQDKVVYKLFKKV